MSTAPHFASDGVHVDGQMIPYGQLLAQLDDDDDDLPQPAHALAVRSMALARASLAPPALGPEALALAAAPAPTPPASLDFPEGLDTHWRDQAFLRTCARAAFNMYEAKSRDTAAEEVFPGEGLAARTVDARGDLHGVQPAFGYFVETSSATLVVTWCGSTTLADWLNNGSFTPVTSSRWGGDEADIRAHNGMSGIVENDLALYEADLQRAIEKHGVETLVFTGHSLAGGLAQVAHLLVRGEALKNPGSPWGRLLAGAGGRAPLRVKSVGFSAPMACAFPATPSAPMRALADQLNDNALTVVYGIDVVPRLPSHTEYAVKCFEAGVAEAARRSIPRWVPGMITGLVRRFVAAKKREALAALTGTSLLVDELLFVAGGAFRHSGTVLYVPAQAEDVGDEDDGSHEGAVWAGLRSCKGDGYKDLLGAPDLDAAARAGAVVSTLWDHHMKLRRFAGYRKGGPAVPIVDSDTAKADATEAASSA